MMRITLTDEDHAQRPMDAMLNADAIGVQPR